MHLSTFFILSLPCVTPCLAPCDPENTHNLIQEPQHPEGELGAVGHVPVIGKDVRILHTCNLRKVLAATANFEGVFAINLEVALGLTVFHIVRLGQAAYRIKVP